MINVYIITHKKFICPDINIYKPLKVGNNNADFGYIDDSTQDNISKKNPNYCELTGLYWIWKNDIESDVVGICHYRRYFTKGKILKSVKRNFLTEKDIKKYLKYNDIILPKLEIYKESAYEQYCQNSGFSKDLDAVRKIIEKKFPDYVKSYDDVMKKNKMFQYNMMICDKKTYNEYCEWLFSILFELEKKVDLAQYNNYQKRIYGFLGERLLNVWVYKNNLKIKQCSVVNTEAGFKDKIKISLRRIKNYIIFKLTESKR